MKIFLVDFENVKSKGLTGIESLEENDKVIIFYSENSDTIRFEMHRKVRESTADIQYLKVDVGGKNALDFHLSTLLGYLVSKNLYTHIFIISNDKGFDFLHDFWSRDDIESENKAVVFRTKTISGAINYANHNIIENQEDNVSENTEQNRSEEDNVCDVTDGTSENNEDDYSENVEMCAPSEPTEEIEIAGENDENKKKNNVTRSYFPTLFNILTKAELNEEDAVLISSLLLKSGTKEEFHNLLAKNFKQQATEIYKLLRPRYLKLKEMYYNEHPEEQKEQTDEKTENVLSEKLSEMLSDFCSADDLTTVENCFRTSENKHELYIRMIKEFKREKGCRIYNAIKGEYSGMLRQK